MKIYIPTRGRPDKQVTYNNLPPELQAKTTLVVNEYEAHAYDNKYNLLVVPPTITNLPKKRQYIVELHDSAKFGPKMIQLDDDLGFDVRRTDMRVRFRKSEPEDLVEGFSLVEKLLDEYPSGGIRHREMAQDAPDVDYVCRVSRALAFDTRILLREQIYLDRLIAHEDFDCTLQLLRKGYKNFNVSTIIQGQGASNADGGCSIYRDYEKQEQSARGLHALHPDFVKIAIKKSNNWKNWSSDTRVDVTMQWKKAYAEGVKNHGDRYAA